eukprot:TRINITY_DN777_c0_g1_i4.p3 TRINITY_DN777_c0_g1~~TRINITY_DN777_c0_g1_i4.p3  ORF type:complete len:240 (+),score=98.53 TRINITY_DN777_c0_g1_i4:1032-1751(+)
MKPHFAMTLLFLAGMVEGLKLGRRKEKKRKRRRWKKRSKKKKRRDPPPQSIRSLMGDRYHASHALLGELGHETTLRDDIALSSRDGGGIEAGKKKGEEKETKKVEEEKQEEEKETKRVNDEEETILSRMRLTLKAVMGHMFEPEIMKTPVINLNARMGKYIENLQGQVPDEEIMRLHRIAKYVEFMAKEYSDHDSPRVDLLMEYFEKIIDLGHPPRDLLESISVADAPFPLLWPDARDL